MAVELAFSPAEKIARYRRRKREAGQCIEGGCWRPSESERCGLCAAIHARKERKARKRGSHGAGNARPLDQ